MRALKAFILYPGKDDEPSRMRIVTLQPDETGNDTASFDKAYYEVSGEATEENPAPSLQEVLIALNEKMKEGQ